MSKCAISKTNTRTSRLGGDPPAYPGVGRSGSTFLNKGGCVTRCTTAALVRGGHTRIKRLLCHASRGIPTGKVAIHALCVQWSTTCSGPKSTRVRTRSIKVAPCGDIKDDTGYGKQNPSAVLTVERYEGLGGVGLKQDRRRVRFGHP